jgi:alkylation response protein AidB-like acyl-CoA dehydrogenase
LEVEMDFNFSDDQVALRDAVARWVEKDFAFERRHAIAKRGGATRDVYRELCDLGLAGLAVAPEHGGLGFGPIEAMVVMEELGRGLVNAPYAAGALMAPALLAGGPGGEAWLARVADGSALVVPALHEAGLRYRGFDAPAAMASHGASAWRVSGRKQLVPAGDEADAFIVPAREGDGGLGLFLVERSHAGVRAYPTQDGARAADITLADAPATRLTNGAGAAEALERAQGIGLAAACAEGVGAMDRLVAITVEYLNTRKQFGATLASFQALRHRMADVKMQLELGRSMSYFASLKLGEPAAQRQRALSQAKVQLGQSLRFVGQHCIQLHGGIGVTDECAASHYFKRLTMIELAFGDTLHHLGEVSARMTETAGVFA